MADDLEWEEWDPESTTFPVHMFAGSLAGLAEHISIFPIDTLKTNMQCERCGSQGPFQTVECAKNMIRQDGLFRLWRGVSATFAGCVPAHAAYFSVFESTKASLGVDLPGHRPLEAAFCGASATTAHDFFMTPFDVVKQRMQLGYYKSVSHCVRSVFRVEGLRAFYRSLPTTMMMNMPYGCVMVATNESAKKFLNPSGQYSFQSCIMAGVIAGGVAGALTNPLDVIKTRLQTQDLEPFIKPLGSQTAASGTNFSFSRLATYFNFGAAMNPVAPYTTAAKGGPAQPLCESAVIYSTANINVASPRYHGMFQTAKLLYIEAGFKGFYRGVSARILIHAPSVAISWTTYETIKHLFVAASGSS